MIKGLASLEFKLNKLSAEAATNFLHKAGAIVERDAKTNCPVDDGQLRNSIAYRVEDNKCIIGTNVEYAPYVHQGTGIYAVNGDGRKDPWSYKDSEGEWHTTIGQQPQPFLTSALDSNRTQLQKLFNEAVKESISNG